MKKLALIFFLTVVVSQQIAAVTVSFPKFTPLKDYVIEKIAEAESRIYLLTYELTSTDIATALILASFRGVTVRVLVNRSGIHSIYSRYRYLKKNEVNIRMAAFKSNYPYSIIIIDEKTYKFHGHLSKKFIKSNYNLEILAEKKTTTFFSKNFHKYYQSGIGVDPGAFLVQLPRAYINKRKIIKLPRKRLPQQTILQKRDQLLTDIKEKKMLTPIESVPLEGADKKNSDQPFEIDNIIEKENPDEESL